MEKFIDLTGQKFGKLTIIKRESNNAHGSSRWLCKCDCGNEKIILSDSLRSGDSKSCGCYRIECFSLSKGESAFNETYHRYKDSLRRRKILFSLSKEEFLSLSQEDCFYCGKNPSNVAKGRKNNGDFIYNGIDRLNSDEGYTIENSVPCCWICNKAKNSMPISEFKEWINRVYSHLNQVTKV